MGRWVETLRHTLLFVVLHSAVLGCSVNSLKATLPPEADGPVSVIPLPSPRLEGKMSLEQALLNRRSIRSFTTTPLTSEQIGQLLWAAQGITDPRGHRTSPSAGALYPLELYVVDHDSVYHYLAEGHELEPTVEGNRVDALFRAALEQEAVSEAPITNVVAAVYERTAVKYSQRAERYVHLEAGHAAQNILLQAVSLGLGAVPIGAFHDQEVQQALELPQNHQPLYLIPVGHPG